MTQKAEPEGDGAKTSEEVTRREVLDAAIGGGTLLLSGTVAYPIVRYVGAPAPDGSEDLEVVAGKASEVAAGKAVPFKFGSKPALLVRDTPGGLRAFVAICTHLSCVVQFRPELGNIWCACHNGHFDLAGRNIKGPPPRPLEELALELRGDVVVAKKGPR